MLISPNPNPNYSDWKFVATASICKKYAVENGEHKVTVKCKDSESCAVLFCQILFYLFLLNVALIKNDFFVVDFFVRQVESVV